MSLACVVNQLMLMPAGSVWFSLTAAQVSCHCPCSHSYSDISLTYSHIPTLLAHIPCPRHQQYNADIRQCCSIFMHGCTGRLSLLVFCTLILTYHWLTPIFPHPLPMSLACVINQLILMPTSAVRFSHMAMQVSCHCPCSQPYSDRSPTYSHIPVSLAHIPFPCHQPTKADTHQCGLIFTHGCTGKLSLPTFIALFWQITELLPYSRIPCPHPLPTSSTT